MNTPASPDRPAARLQWQSGYLSYVTAELVTEFSSVDPLHVIDAFNLALVEAPAIQCEASLLQKAREILRGRMSRQPEEQLSAYASA